MESVEITIIGAGVVGLAIAERLSPRYENVFLVEKEDSFGRGASSRNSEVIHAGMYYPRNSLKANACVEGRRLLYALCEKQRIPCKKLGKLIVATCAEEEGQLERLLAQGKENGVEGLEIIGRATIKALEPNIEARSALSSAESGIIDSHAIMNFLFTKAKDSGASIAFQSKVARIEKKASGYEITTTAAGAETFTFKSEIVINAAGLYSDIIAKMAGMDTDALRYTLSFCKGEYFRLPPQKSAMIQRLIYPVPEQSAGGPASAFASARPRRSSDIQRNEGGLGIHLTPDMRGQVRLGPDAEYMSERRENYDVDAGKRKYFFDSVRVFAPFIKEGDFYPDTAGIRAKLQAQGEGFRDFVIREEGDNGFPGFINCIGIESPGLTAALSIAAHVERLLPIRNNAHKLLH